VNLKITLPSDREILMMREFDAPRPLVWRAFTEPELLKRWFLGPDGWTLTVCEMDVRVGGTYRWIWTQPGRPDLSVSGVFKEVVAPERMVATERFDEAWYPGEAVNTTVLTEKDGKTHLALTMRLESKAARDNALKSGMERGVEASYNRLADYLASIESQRGNS